LISVASDILWVTDLASGTIYGASDQDVIGIYMDGCGDANGDGLADLALGTRRLVYGDYPARNEGYLLMGGTGIEKTVDLDSPPSDSVIISHDHMGVVSVAAGDFNGDGLPIPCSVIPWEDLTTWGVRCYCMEGQTFLEKFVLRRSELRE